MRRSPAVRRRGQARPIMLFAFPKERPGRRAALFPPSPPPGGTRTMTHRASSCPQLRRPLAGALFASLAASLLFAAAASAGAAVSETPPDPPVLHFAASGEHAFSSGRITVDARPPADGCDAHGHAHRPLRHETDALHGARGQPAFLDRSPDRGRDLAGGRGGGDREARATARARRALRHRLRLPRRRPRPSCSVSLSAPKTPTAYLDAEIVINTCDATAVTGEIATATPGSSRTGWRFRHSTPRGRLASCGRACREAATTRSSKWWMTEAFPEAVRAPASMWPPATPPLLAHHRPRRRIVAFDAAPTS